MLGTRSRRIHPSSNGKLVLPLSPHTHLLVAVVHAGDELLEEEPRRVLGQPVRPLDELEELASRRVLHDDEDVGRRQEHLHRAGSAQYIPALIHPALFLHVMRRAGGNDGESGQRQASTGTLLPRSVMCC